MLGWWFDERDISIMYVLCVNTLRCVRALQRVLKWETANWESKRWIALQAVSSSLFFFVLILSFEDDLTTDPKAKNIIEYFSLCTWFYAVWSFITIYHHYITMNLIKIIRYYDLCSNYYSYMAEIILSSR